MLKVELIGNIGRDPEMSYTPNGVAVTKFSVASSEYSKKDGEKQQDTTWVNCVCFNQQAETANEYLHKGNKVFIRGKLQLRQYTTKDNRQGVSVECVVSEMEFLTPKDARERPYKNGKPLSDEELAELDDPTSPNFSPF
jgi:single-strand DNA-binding protein